MVNVYMCVNLANPMPTLMCKRKGMHFSCLEVDRISSS